MLLGGVAFGVLKAGDELLKVNGKPVEGQPLRQLVDEIRALESLNSVSSSGR